MKLKYAIFVIVSMAFLCFQNAFADKDPKSCFTPLPDDIEDHLEDSRPVNKHALIHLLVGNSAVGLTPHSKSMYELFFKHDGKVVYRKNANDKEVCEGKWWIEGDVIYSKWVTDMKTIEAVQKYYHIIENVYISYHEKEDCFGRPFMVFKGDAFNLKNAKLTK